MSIKMYNMFPLNKLLKVKGSSEKAAASAAGVSRLTLRSLKAGRQDSRLSSWIRLAQMTGRDLILLAVDPVANHDLSVQAVSHHILRDGSESWKIHVMNFVDEFRRSLDTSLFILPPLNDLPIHLKALLASIVCSLCEEAEVAAPAWARKRFTLPEPWFVSQSEALKAMMILESPLPFRRNQIFVGQNFLDRA